MESAVIQEEENRFACLSLNTDKKGFARLSLDPNKGSRPSSSSASSNRKCNRECNYSCPMHLEAIRE